MSISRKTESPWERLLRSRISPNRGKRGECRSLQISDPSGLLDINSAGGGGPGGPDGDITTVQTTLRAASTFTVDAFAITLWEDTFIINPSVPSVLATVTFDEFSVHQIPEPAGIGVLAIVGAAAWHRRRRTVGMNTPH